MRSTAHYARAGRSRLSARRRCAARPWGPPVLSFPHPKPVRSPCPLNYTVREGGTSFHSKVEDCRRSCQLRCVAFPANNRIRRNIFVAESRASRLGCFALVNTKSIFMGVSETAKKSKSNDRSSIQRRPLRPACHRRAGGGRVLRRRIGRDADRRTPEDDERVGAPAPAN